MLQIKYTKKKRIIRYVFLVVQMVVF